MEPSSSTPQTALFTVPPGQGGKRLDLFLASRMPAFSRSQVQGLIEKGNVEPQFPVKNLKAGLLVMEGQSFQVTVPPTRKSEMPAQPLPLDIVFEDGHMLVLNKAAGLVVHPGAGNPDQTLLNALIAHCPDLEGVGGVQRPGLVHRLDKDTSGLLVVAKTDKAYRSLVRQLRGRKLGREYLGIVKGTVEGRGTVDAPIGRHVTARKKMAVRAEGGKPAVTHFRALESNEKASFLLLKLETGRTHQIRVHMAYIHHPIWGDGVYGGGGEGAARQMLHAFRISFQHPETGKVEAFAAPPPQDFVDCLSSLQIPPPAWSGVVWEKPQ